MASAGLTPAVLKCRYVRRLAWYGGYDQSIPESQVRMLTADVAELQAALSHYGAQLQTGEQVIVADQRREIARRVPTMTARLAALDYHDMVTSGIIIPPETQASPEFCNLPRVSDPEGVLRKAVLAEREERA